MTAERQRLLALGILGLVLAAGWLVVVQPVIDAFLAQRDDIEQSQRMLAAYEARIAMKPLVQARLDALKRNESSSTGLIGGASAELAAANIQSLVKTLIESASGQVRSAQNLPPVSGDGFERIQIQYDVSVPMTKLKDMAYRIETATPYLFLDGIDLRAPESWDTSGVQADPPNVDIRWTVSGYRWTGAR